MHFYITVIGSILSLITCTVINEKEKPNKMLQPDSPKCHAILSFRLSGRYV